MRHFRTLLAHELRSAALSWNTWAAAGLFLALMGGIHFFALVDAARAPTSRAPVEATLWFFWLPLLLRPTAADDAHLRGGTPLGHARRAAHHAREPGRRGLGQVPRRLDRLGLVLALVRRVPVPRLAAAETARTRARSAKRPPSGEGSASSP